MKIKSFNKTDYISSRKSILKLLVQTAHDAGSNSAHIGGALSSVDILTVLFKYFLGLNKINTYSYAHRPYHINAVEASGFRREGVFREDTKVNGEWVDAIIASCLKSEYLKQFPPPQ